MKESISWRLPSCGLHVCLFSGACVSIRALLPLLWPLFLKIQSNCQRALFAGIETG